MRAKSFPAVLAASFLVLLASGTASTKDSPGRAPEELFAAPNGRPPTTRNPEMTWRGRVVRLTTYPASDASRFEIVLSPGVDDSPEPARKLKQVTVYTDPIHGLRPNDWVVVRGKKFCVRPDPASGKFEAGHLSGVWEVTLDDRDSGDISEAVRTARPYMRAPGLPECSRAY